MSSQEMHIEPRRPLDSVQMVMIEQVWDQPDIQDLAAATRRALSQAGALERISAGDEIAITAGSRGIASIPEILRAVVQCVRERGGQPFLFPAMGSHGGGTAEGQLELLRGLGIDETTIGAPIRATMQVVQIGTTAQGIPVYLDAYAAKADGIILVNRIKKHTNYDGPYESGLCKMAVIGMGKHRQAVTVHRYGNTSFRELIPEIAAVTLERAPILAGLAIVENAWGGVAYLEGLRPNEILEKEPTLLAESKRLGAKIPFRDIDIAIVERMGKEISGTGMDCYVIGRRRIIGQPEWEETPQIRSLVVLDLTEASHGNGVGIGLADFCTRRLVDKIDWRVTRANIMTSGNLERGKIPLTYDSDREALEAASFRERATPTDALRIVAIRDTLHLSKLLVSLPLAQEAEQRPDLRIVGRPRPLPLDKRGNWITPFDNG